MAVKISLQLLLLAPTSVAEEIQSDVINTIQTAALAFAKHRDESTQSCSLQAKFLNQVISKIRRYPRIQRLTPSAGNDAIAAHTSAAPGLTSRLPALPEPLVPPADVEVGGISVSPGDDLDLSFSDSGSWDEIFARAGLNTDDNIFLV
jgi:hypothetical protein